MYLHARTHGEHRDEHKGKKRRNKEETVYICGCDSRKTTYASSSSLDVICGTVYLDFLRTACM